MQTYGFHVEEYDKEELESTLCARALLSHRETRPLSELSVLLLAALVYHFPRRGGRGRASIPPPRTVAQFQEALIDTIRNVYPTLWERLCVSETLDEVEATRTVQELGSALLDHRFDFQLTRPDL